MCADIRKGFLFTCRHQERNGGWSSCVPGYCTCLGVFYTMCLESPSSLWPDTPAGVVRIALPLLLSADRGDSRGVVQNMTGRRKFWRFSSTGPKLTPVTEEE